MFIYSLESQLIFINTHYNRIRNLREDADLTQCALFLHIAQTQYSRYERGYSSLPVNLLIQLADFYNTTTDYIPGRTDDPAPHTKKQR